MNLWDRRALRRDAASAADRKNSMGRISNIYFHPMRARTIVRRTRCARLAW